MREEGPWGLLAIQLAEPAGFRTMRDPASKARRTVPREPHLRLTSDPHRHARMYTHNKSMLVVM